MSGDLVSVVVASGHSMIDGTGASVFAGQIAKVAATEVAGLIEAGFIVDPADKPGERSARNLGEAGRHAWNLFVTSQNAVAVAVALRPSQPGAAQRAKQLIGYADEIRSMAKQFLTAVNDGDGAA